MQKNGHAPNDFEMDILRVLKYQLERYPFLSLVDIYKSFFQDAFGPEHLLFDPEKARESFKYELEAMKTRGCRAVEPCGMGICFCRIPMDLVIDGIIDEGNYFSAFLAGASAFKNPDVGIWKQTWCCILEVLDMKREFIQDFWKDSELILMALEKGSWALNHSSRYRELYDPHYRIFTMEQQRELYPQPPKTNKTDRENLCWL